jgi:CubicO group peptidase (beta-lactamase class C family)
MASSLSSAQQQAISALMREHEVPGLALAVIEDGRLAASYLAGVTQHGGTPITADTLFQAASLSKPVFAYGVLRLCAAGALSLDTPLATIAPDPDLNDSSAGMITARHVLSHTTGLPNWREDLDPPTLRTIAVPGNRFGYSGEGFEYLQRAIERRTGQPLHVFAHDTVLAPLGMVRSRYDWDASPTGELLDDGDGSAAAAQRQIISSAAWSLLTTAEDYARFLLAMLVPGTHSTSDRDAAIVAEMLTPHTSIRDQPQLHWSLGWGLQETATGAAFWHWGGPQNGYASYVIGVPVERRGAVVLTNGTNGHQVCRAIVEQVLVLLGDDHPAFRWILPFEAWRPDGRSLASA